MEWQLDWFQKYFFPTCIKGLLNTLCCNIQMLIQAVNSQAWALKRWMSMWWEGSEGQGAVRDVPWFKPQRGETQHPQKAGEAPSYRSKDSVLRSYSSQSLIRNQGMPETDTEMWLSKTTSCGTLKHFGLILPHSFSRKSWRQGWACFCAVRLCPASHVMSRCMLGSIFQ